MTNELLEQYKKELLENVNAEMQEEGKLMPFIQLIGFKSDLEKPAIVHIAAPFQDEEDKDLFVQQAIPEICRKLKKNNIDVELVTFVAECWMTVIDDKTGKSKKSEVVMIIYSDKNGDKTEAYDIIRHDYEVDEKGELTSKIEYKKNEKMSSDETIQVGGRFSDLYKQFRKQLDKE